MTCSEKKTKLIVPSTNINLFQGAKRTGKITEIGTRTGEKAKGRRRMEKERRNETEEG